MVYQMIDSSGALACNSSSIISYANFFGAGFCFFLGGFFNLGGGGGGTQAFVFFFALGGDGLMLGPLERPMTGFHARVPLSSC